LVGYDRFEGERAYGQLAELYRAVRLYVNFFQPSMKLRTKTRTGSRVRRMYGPAQTPYQRALASGVLDAPSQRRLNAVYPALDKGGTGLGLAIVRSLVSDGLRGEVEVTSRPEEGTAITLRLPRSAAAESEPTRPATKQSARL
jgi:hypothetical protein